MEKRKRQSRTTRNDWIMIVICLAITVFFLGVSLFGVSWFANPFLSLDFWDTDLQYTGIDAQAAIEKSFDLHLPDKAHSFYYDHVGFQDDLIHARFTVPAEQTIPTLQASKLLCFTYPLDETEELTQVFGHNISWWLEETATGDYLEGECNNNGYEFLMVIVDRSNTDKWVVYLRYMNM